MTDHKFDESDDDAGDEEDTYDSWFDRESLATPILLEGLVAAAEKGGADAHYALALIYARPMTPTTKPTLAASTGTTKNGAAAYSLASRKNGRTHMRPY